MTNPNPWAVIIVGGLLLAALGYFYLKITLHEQVQREIREEVTTDPTTIRDRANEVFDKRFGYFCKKHGLFYQPFIKVGDREEPGTPIKPSSRPVSVPQSLAAFNVEISPHLVRATKMTWAEAEESLRRIAGEIQGDCQVKIGKPDGQTAYRVEVYTQGYGD